MTLLENSNLANVILTLHRILESSKCHFDIRVILESNKCHFDIAYNSTADECQNDIEQK